MPSQVEVLVLNYDGPSNKIVMSEMNPRTNSNPNECWLADQAMFNKKCSTYQLPDTETCSVPDISYKEAVTLADVTKLDGVEFEDVKDLGQVSKASKVKAKLVNFLDKFGDSDITEYESWEPTQPERRYLRHRQRN